MTRLKLFCLEFDYDISLVTFCFFHQVFHVYCGDRRRSFFVLYTWSSSVHASLTSASTSGENGSNMERRNSRSSVVYFTRLGQSSINSLMNCDLIVSTGHFRVKCAWSSGTDRLLVPVTVARELATDPGIADHAANVLE